MACGSRNDTVVTTSHRSRTVMDLTGHNPNIPMLAEGPEIRIKPVGVRRVSAGDGMNRIFDRFALFVADTVVRLHPAVTRPR